MSLVESIYSTPTLINNESMDISIWTQDDDVIKPASHRVHTLINDPRWEELIKEDVDNGNNTDQIKPRGWDKEGRRLPTEPKADLEKRLTKFLTNI